jgi:glucosamine 6-phosphate synthetase-like amidotransferase/phosphosugar isomerase protein
MCGVIGLIYERSREDLGVIAAELLKTLEYRGYDSTGAAFQGSGEDVDLKKDVGAPSQMITKLGIDRAQGQILCAQVRWATFGAVDRVNAQPHVVRCMGRDETIDSGRLMLYGAHNGNVTNCDALKAWLTNEGHAVQSDNDGEMVVHTVEHFFAQILKKQAASEHRNPALRARAMREAITLAAQQLKGSYAAVIVDPITRTLHAIKMGSSLYFGVGESDAGRFAIASSDLSSVLKLTRAVVPMAEGELVEFDGPRYQLRRIADGQPIERTPTRSRLRAQDTELRAPYSTFMEQEIHAQVETSRDVIRLFLDESATDRLAPLTDVLTASDRAEIRAALDQIRDQVSDASTVALLQKIRRSPIVEATMSRLLPELRVLASTERTAATLLHSSERSLFYDLNLRASSAEERVALWLLDAVLEREETEDLARTVDQLTQHVVASIERSGRIFIVCCGSSFNAAKTASIFFNELAGVEVVPLLPGEFRGQYGGNVRDGDLFISVSQSGETKDLIDVLNGVIASKKDVVRVALVNNMNSTLAQEKSNLVIPLRCGPEIAVAATKSFINQLTTLYCLALAVGERRRGKQALAPHRELLRRLPDLIQRTLDDTRGPIRQAARSLFLKPSIHILATRLVGVAKEGALKIREVVLNHTEGFEASEFKHGPNTILGFNTVFGLDQLERLIEIAATTGRISGAALRRALRADYPLVYVTGPSPRDVDLTVSQINTHKIRGAMTLVVAEDNAQLRTAASKAPSDNPDYQWTYVELPKTGDVSITAFTATVALQELALEMSLLKMAHLDALGIEDHGVHPDVPKNVSKSITVD